jgi:hypothetical protein
VNCTYIKMYGATIKKNSFLLLQYFSLFSFIPLWHYIVRFTPESVSLSPPPSLSHPIYFHPSETNTNQIHNSCRLLHCTVLYCTVSN